MAGNPYATCDLPVWQKRSGKAASTAVTAALEAGAMTKDGARLEQEGAPVAGRCDVVYFSRSPIRFQRTRLRTGIPPSGRLL
jgi:hypothetical protein